MTVVSGGRPAPTHQRALSDAVIFDIGNVLIAWDPHPAVAAMVGDAQATRFLADQDFDFPAWNRRQDAGRSWDRAEQAAEAAHPHWALAIRAYRANFTQSMTGAIEGTVQILGELHDAGVPLFALTNWSAELFPAALARFAFLDLFEDIIVSGREGVAKPDHAIFEILAKRVGQPLAGRIYVDDGPLNVEAAARAGLDAILFTDPSQLRDDLVSRGLPIQPT